MLEVAVIDDDVELVGLLADYLIADKRFAPLQVFDSPPKALEAGKKGKFSVVLVDLRLPNDSGLRWIRRLRESCPGLRILAYTGADAEDGILTSIEAGADGYLLKQGPPSLVVEAILEASKGQPIASGVVLRAIFRHLRRDLGPARHQDLSRAEVRVLELSSRGYDCKTVAKKLGISVQTVYVHNRRIFRKLGVTNRLAAIARLKDLEGGSALGRGRLDGVISTADQVVEVK